MDDRRYHKLDPYIHELSKRCKLKEDSIKQANKQLKEMLEQFLIPVMNEVDEDFKNLYQRVHYSGSFYENLRIRTPDEFDLNLELRSQSRSLKFLKVCSNEEHPGFVQIQHQSSVLNGKWVDNNGYVLQYKVLSWLQSVVDKALATPKIKNGPWEKIERTMSGPAVTLNVKYIDGSNFKVDLVPVFVFHQSEWPNPPVRQPVVTKSYGLEWCVVPKPNNFIDSNGNHGTFWRISFYHQEKEIMKGKNHLKNSLKLLKMMRDEEGWHCLSSYYLKTVCLWIDTSVENDTYWNTGIGIVFMNMMRTLRDNLNHGAIPFFWDERNNLLSSVNQAEIQKIRYRIERIVSVIDRNIDIDNPRIITTFFGKSISSSGLILVQQSREVDAEVEDESEDGYLALAPQQERQFDYTNLALGIGAVALTGILAYREYNNNRNQ